MLPRNTGSAGSLFRSKRADENTEVAPDLDLFAVGAADSAPRPTFALGRDAMFQPPHAHPAHPDTPPHAHPVGTPDTHPGYQAQPQGLMAPHSPSPEAACAHNPLSAVLQFHKDRARQVEQDHISARAAASQARYQQLARQNGWKTKGSGSKGGGGSSSSSSPSSPGGKSGKPGKGSPRGAKGDNPAPGIAGVAAAAGPLGGVRLMPPPPAAPAPTPALPAAPTRKKPTPFIPKQQQQQQPQHQQGLGQTHPHHTPQGSAPGPSGPAQLGAAQGGGMPPVLPPPDLGARPGGVAAAAAAAIPLPLPVPPAASSPVRQAGRVRAVPEYSNTAAVHPPPEDPRDEAPLPSSSAPPEKKRRKPAAKKAAPKKAAAKKAGRTTRRAPAVDAAAAHPPGSLVIGGMAIPLDGAADDGCADAGGNLAPNPGHHPSLQSATLAEILAAATSGGSQAAAAPPRVALHTGAVWQGRFWISDALDVAPMLHTFEEGWPPLDKMVTTACFIPPSGGAALVSCERVSLCIEQVVALLIHPGVEKIVHNSQHVLSAICHAMRERSLHGTPVNVHDTRTMMWMVASAETQFNGPSGMPLEECFALHNIFGGDAERGCAAAAARHALQGALPFTFLHEALLRDVVLRLQLMQPLHSSLKAKLAEGRVAHCFASIECPMGWLLAKMHVEGFPLDLGVLHESVAGLQSILEATEAEAATAAKMPGFNIQSTDDLRAVLFEQLQLQRSIPPGTSLARTKRTEKYSTDKENLKVLADLHPLPRLVLRHRAISKVLSTYIQNLTSHAKVSGGGCAHRVHPYFNLEGTDTGRLSCSAPNLQNQPRTDHPELFSSGGMPGDSQATGDGSCPQVVQEVPSSLPLYGNIRRAFRPLDPDSVLVALDYSQIELRVLAHLSQDPVLCGALSSGGDIHRSVASRVFSKPEADISNTERQIGKKVVFGVMYGQGAKALSGTLGVSIHEAAVFIGSFKRGFPVVAAWSDGVLEGCRAAGYVRTYANRIRRLPLITSMSFAERSHAERQAVNTTIQGSAADIIKIAMLSTAQLRSPVQATLLCQIHDEILVSVPRSALNVTVPALLGAMQGAVTLSVPLIATASTGPSWGELSPWVPAG